ncbi:MAG: hypothetical protein AAF628_23710 [Planctomycetota bacterium]
MNSFTSPSSPDGTPPPSVAIVVVHGIGNPAPAETINAFVDAWSAHRGAFTAEPERRAIALPDYDGSDRDALRTFPCHLRYGRLFEQRAVVAEVWWGSRSRTRDFLPEFARAVIELLGLMIGLRTVGDTQRSPDAHPATRRAGVLARSLAAVLIGPVLALNVLLLMTTAAHTAVETWVGQDPDEHALARRVLCALVLAGAAALGIHRARQLAKTDRRPLREQLRERRYASLYLPLWLSLAGIGAATTLWVAITDPSWDELGRAQVGLVVASFVPVSMLQVAIALHWFATRNVERTERGGRQLLAVVPTLQCAVWGLVVPLTWRVLTTSLPKATADRTNELLAAAVTVDGLAWVLLLIVGTIVWSDARRARSAKENPPRLIVSERAAKWGLSLAALASVISIAVYLGWVPDAIVNLQTNGAWRVYLGAVLVALAPMLRVALHLADDVLSYLRKYTAATHLMQARPIRSRFRRVIEYLHTQHGVDHVAILAHSQGSVIAIDELAVPTDQPQGIGVFRRSLGETTLQAYEALAGRTTLITMGSPFGHLYQHYFPQHYPGSASAEWMPLRRRVSRWINLYRTHDYVGTTVHPLAEGFPENVRLGAGGHVGYWTSKKAITQIERALRATQPSPTAR